MELHSFSTLAATHVGAGHPLTWLVCSLLLLMPLLLPAAAAPGLKFVPVPAVTGFAGVWDIIKERCTPHPQPIVSRRAQYYCSYS